MHRIRYDRVVSQATDESLDAADIAKVVGAKSTKTAEALSELPQK